MAIEVEARRTKGKGWMVAGVVAMVVGFLSCASGKPDGGVGLIVIGAALFGIGRAIWWWNYGRG